MLVFADLRHFFACMRHRCGKEWPFLRQKKLFKGTIWKEKSICVPDARRTALQGKVSFASVPAWAATITDSEASMTWEAAMAEAVDSMVLEMKLKCKTQKI